MIYSRTLDEHISPLIKVPSCLREYKLYVKMEKCEFAMQEIKFLRHLVSQNQVRMDPKKVQATVEPLVVKELRSFVGLTNYYKKFIAGYSKKADPLTDLLKNNVRWVGSKSCINAFDMLKEAISYLAAS